MALNFQDISMERQADYNAIFAQCPGKASDYNFINIWGWAEEYGLKWAWEKDLVWIQQTRPGVFMWAPVGDWKRIDWQTVFKRHFENPPQFVRIPLMLCDLWKNVMTGNVQTEESRGDWDYLYYRRDLVALSGNRFHKKKNLVNQFQKKYDYKYFPLTEDIIHKAFGMQEDWCTWRDCEAVDALAAENRVIKKVFLNWKDLTGITGGAIVVSDRLVAYTIGAYMGENTILIHFEKGNAEYRGIYQAINQMFLENDKTERKLVNREQDLNDEGLRRAKMSYRPFDFIKKFRVSL